MSNPVDPETLSPDDLTTFRIGQIMRATVRMESTLRELHARLQDVPYADLKEPTTDKFATLVSEVRNRLCDLSGFPITSEALETLDAATAIYRERNRFAHDVHIQAADDSIRRIRLAYSASKRRPTDIPTGTLREALDQIRAVTTRIVVTSQLAAVWLPRESEPLESKDGWYAERLVTTMRQTSLTPTVAAPLPPGTKKARPPQ